MPGFNFSLFFKTQLLVILQSYLSQIILTSGPQTPRILGLSQPAGNERPPTAKKTPAEVKTFIGMEYIGMEEMKNAKKNLTNQKELALSALGWIGYCT